MRLLRALIAVLLLAATTLGASLHSASGHAMAPAVGAAHEIHRHEHASSAVHASNHAQPCRECPTKAWRNLCDMACSAAVAVTDNSIHVIGTRLEYPVTFAALASRTGHEAVLAPDPFPPRPSRLS